MSLREWLIDRQENGDDGSGFDDFQQGEGGQEMSKTKEKVLEIEEMLRDQAGQILYFEASMEEDKAFEMVLERLRFIYEAGIQEGKK